MEQQLKTDVRNAVPVSEMRKKYSPQFIREHYLKEWIQSESHMNMEYLTWLFGECQFVSDINSVICALRSYDESLGGWKPVKISLLDYLCCSVSYSQDKLDSVNFLLSLGAKSILGLDVLLYRTFSRGNNLISLRLLDAGANPSRFPNPFLGDDGISSVYYSRLATRAACIAVLSLHGKLPAGQVAQQCLSRDMLYAIARAMWKKRFGVK